MILNWEIIKDIGILFTTLAAIYAFWVKVLKPMVDSYIEKTKRERTRDEKLDKIVYQLLPNGGG